MATVPTFRVDDQTFHLDDESDPYEAAFKKQDAFLFNFGPYGGVRVLVYRSSGYRSLDDCLEVAADTLKDAGKTGLFVSGREIDALIKEAEEDGYEGDEAYEQATADLTYTEAGYLTSYEWSVSEVRWGSELYGAGVAKTLEVHPHLADTTDSYEEIEDVLRKAGASASRIKRALDAIEADEG
jgi:hypothetical protein